MELPARQLFGQHYCFLIMRSWFRILGSERALLVDVLHDFLILTLKSATTLFTCYRFIIHITYQHKGKGKVTPRTDQDYFFNLDARWGWVIKVTPRPLYPRERPSTHCIGSWVGLRVGLDGCGKISPPPHRDLIPGPPSP